MGTSVPEDLQEPIPRPRPWFVQVVRGLLRESPHPIHHRARPKSSPIFPSYLPRNGVSKQKSSGSTGFPGSSYPEKSPEVTAGTGIPLLMVGTIGQEEPRPESKDDETQRGSPQVGTMGKFRGIHATDSRSPPSAEGTYNGITRGSEAGNRGLGRAGIPE